MANRQLLALAFIVSLALAVVEARNFHAAMGGPRPWQAGMKQQSALPAEKGSNPFLKRLKQIVFQPDGFYDPGMDHFAFGEAFNADEYVVCFFKGRLLR